MPSPPSVRAQTAGQIDHAPFQGGPSGPPTLSRAVFHRAADGLKRQRLDRPYVRREGKLQPASWEEALRVVAEKLLTYALGRGVEAEDMPLVRSIVRQSAASKYRFSSLALGIVKSPVFQMNMKPVVHADQRASR